MSVKNPLTSALACLVLIASPTKLYAESSWEPTFKTASGPLLQAVSLIGAPYRWGGHSPESGFDCSGFVQYVYKMGAGVELPRTAREQMREGLAVAADDLQPGDLVFFRTARRSVNHVGVYAGDGQFIHAPNRDKPQITHAALRLPYWKARFAGARRVVTSALGRLAQVQREAWQD